jgi:hypothetical protein
VAQGSAGLALLSLGARPALAGTGVPEAALLLAPGPEDGPSARFAHEAAAALARGLVQAAALRVTVLGGPDGVTAANRFAASTPADGRALLLLPGLAALAHLLGDSRARFEPRHWPAVCGSLQAVALAGRGALADAAPLRLALPAPGVPEAAGLLALDLIGRRTVPVFAASPEAAVAGGAADAMVLAGPALARAGTLGLTPWFSFDGSAGARDPAMPELPCLADVLHDPPQNELVEAARAAAAALRTRALLVLPSLTSANAVALWRGAAQRWAEGEVAAPDPGTRRVGAAEAAATLATLCPSPAVALAYREWVLRRLSWRAG